MVFVDRAYKDMQVKRVHIWRSWQKCGVVRGLIAMIRRRSATEPTNKHMKSGGKPNSNWLKGALGDAVIAVLCGTRRNLRLIQVNKHKCFSVRIFYAIAVSIILTPFSAANSCLISAES